MGRTYEPQQVSKLHVTSSEHTECNHSPTSATVLLSPQLLYEDSVWQLPRLTRSVMTGISTHWFFRFRFFTVLETLTLLCTQLLYQIITDTSVDRSRAYNSLHHQGG